MKRVTPLMAIATFGAVMIAAMFAIVVTLAMHERANRTVASAVVTLAVPPKPTLDRDAYDRKLRQLAHVAEDAAEPQDGTAAKPRLWPVTAAYPEYGAILPFKRIVA